MPWRLLVRRFVAESAQPPGPSGWSRARRSLTSLPSGVRKADIPAHRLRQVCQFILSAGKRPSRQSTAEVERPLGIWLHRFKCNDDGVHDRARAGMSEEEYQRLVETIERAPDAKQLYDRKNTLKNLELIAERAVLLGRLPARRDSSG